MTSTTDFPLRLLAKCTRQMVHISEYMLARVCLVMIIRNPGFISSLLQYVKSLSHECLVIFFCTFLTLLHFGLQAVEAYRHILLCISVSVEWCHDELIFHCAFWRNALDKWCISVISEYILAQARLVMIFKNPAAPLVTAEVGVLKCRL